MDMDFEQEQAGYRRQFFEHDLYRVSRHEAGHAEVADWAWGSGVADIVLGPNFSNGIFIFNVVKGQTQLRRPRCVLDDPSNIEQPGLDGPTARRLVSLAGPVMDCLLEDDRDAHSVHHGIVERARDATLSLSDAKGIGNIYELQEVDVAKVLDILTRRWGRVQARADAVAQAFRERYADEIQEWIGDVEAAA